MVTKISDINGESLEYAKKLIESDEVVAFPTETVYGLGGLATSDEAVKKIYEVKGRPSDNPLIVHIHSDYDLNSLIIDENDYAKKLREKFLPGPLTMVYKSKGVVSSLVSCGLDTLAIRVPSHKGAQEFLKALNLPIAAPSANISKHVSPVTAEHVFNDFNGKIPLILNGGRSSGGIESTVLSVIDKTPVILREGLITYEMIKEVVGSCEISQHKSGDKVMSPGVKYKHYSPNCDTYLCKRDDVARANRLYAEYEAIGKRPYILCDKEYEEKYFKDKNVLSLGENSYDFARNLYDCLRKGETCCDAIIGIELPNEKGVNAGVSNRLKKACAEKNKQVNI